MFSGNLWTCLKEVKLLVVFDGEFRMALVPIQGNRASSRVYFGCTELFRVAAVTSGSLYTCESVLGDSDVASTRSMFLPCLTGNAELLCSKCRGIGPHLGARGKSHGCSRVAAGTCCIFSSYSWDAPSKLMFVQPHHDSGLVTSDNSGISSRLGRAVGMLLEVRWETEGTFPLVTGILGSLSMFKRSQA